MSRSDELRAKIVEATAREANAGRVVDLTKRPPESPVAPNRKINGLKVTGSVISHAVGLIILLAMGMAVLSALGPASCSERSMQHEYRAR